MKKELAGLQDELRSAGADVKWVNPDNIHLTLKFLGDITEEKKTDIANLLDDTASKYKSFETNLFKIGCFPRLESPRVIWVGIDKNCATIEEIADNLKVPLEKLGFPREKRRFSAHLTLGRVRSPKNKDKLVQKIKALEFNSNAFSSVSKLTLFKSTLTPKGSIYTVLYEAVLGKD